MSEILPDLHRMVVEPDATPTETLRGLNVPEPLEQEQSLMHHDSEVDPLVHVNHENFVRGDNYESLAITSLKDAEVNDASPELPNIDVVHIQGVERSEERLSLATLISDRFRTEIRELVFSSDIISLLAGELVMDSIEHQARKLLRGLIHFRQYDGKTKRRAIVFVAYDLGALIVKKAISMAACDQLQWPELFTSSARFVFSGCFQRWDNATALEMKLFEFLHAKRDEDWIQYLTLTSIKSLASASTEMTELFISSKITLRTCVVSLYASGNEIGKIHPVFNSLTATLGLSTELTIQEECQSESEPFPSLSDKICLRLAYSISHQSWKPLEQSLLVLASSQRQFSTVPRLDSHHVLKSVEHQKWIMSHGSSVLHVHGQDSNAIREAAEQLIFNWQTKRQTGPTATSFSFSPRDSTSNSMTNMICSLFLQVLSGVLTRPSYDYFLLLEDIFNLQHGWTAEDLLTIFVTQMPIDSDILILLQNIDECDKKSRTALWASLSSLADAEAPMKFVITSREQSCLQDEFKSWPEILVFEYNLSERGEKSYKASEKDFEAGLESVLCQAGYVQQHTGEILNKLMSLDKEERGNILKLIKSYSNWPTEPLAKNLHSFCSLLEGIPSSSTTSGVLEYALRSVPDQYGLRWTLSWLLDGYRPLSKKELAVMLCYCKRGNEQTFANPSPADVQDSTVKIETWLRGMITFRYSEVYIRDDMLDLLEPGETYIWNEVKVTARKTIARFIIEYLTAPEVQERLDAIYKEYKSHVKSYEDSIPPPLISDGQDIVFYIVQALPYYLSESLSTLESLREELIAPDGAMLSWAKVFWAMSDPSLRPRNKMHVSACDTLLTLGNLNPRVSKILESFSKASPSPIIKSQDVTNGLPNLKGMESLIDAVRARDEEGALDVAGQVISTYKIQQKLKSRTDRTDISWPSKMLWRAIWLNMDRLVEVLLENGTSAEPDHSPLRYFPSPLYLGSYLGNSAIVKSLMKHGANTRVLKDAMYSSLFTAASHGHTDVIKALVAKDSALLELGQPDTPLIIASTLGYWKVVETLLKLGADPNSRGSSQWAPLVMASVYGHVKTMQSLLKNNANPNIPGPFEGDTPLWFAAVRSGNIDCVGLLLEKGADPNHKLIEPPILIEVVNSAVEFEDKFKIFDILVSHAVPVQLDNADAYDGMTPLMHAAQKGDASIVKWLLEHGANINITDHKGRSALMLAVSERYADTVRELLDWKPKLDIVNTSGDTILQTAIHDVHIFEMLLEAGANTEILDRDGSSVINRAAFEDRLEIVRLLVDRKVDITHRDRLGWSPLLDAVYSDNAEMTRILIEGGADVKDTTQRGSSPLHLASNPEVLKTLLEFHSLIDLEMRDIDGGTPIFDAMEQHRNVDCMKLLVRAGANINKQNNKEETVLMRAIGLNMATEMIDFLLSQAGIETNICSKISGTALQIACTASNLDVVTRLIEHGADTNQHVPVSHPSTPLISACLPSSGSRSENIDKIERIVRELVVHGAEVNTIRGTTIYNALSAACFGAGIGTINYLLDNGASAQSPDPLGRLPIHFAAANGIRNFEAMLLGHRADLMVADCAGKNVLHWAAQFGNVKTLDAILSKLNTTTRRRNTYINLPDKDGWSPLCWATRPFEINYMAKMGSETPDFAKTIHYLLEHGANRSVEFQMKTGDALETFTPLSLARLCNAGEEIIHLLTYGLGGAPSSSQVASEKDIFEPIRRYIERTATCDICLNTVFGRSHKCQSCADFDACNKCYGRIDLYHDHIRAETGEPHLFEIRPGHEEEFEDLPSRASTPDPHVGEEEGQAGASRRASNAQTVEEDQTLDLDDIDLSQIAGIEEFDPEGLDNLDDFDQ